MLNWRRIAYVLLRAYMYACTASAAFWTYVAIYQPTNLDVYTIIIGSLGLAFFCWLWSDFYRIE